MFRVENRNIRAVAAEHDCPVWRDSCVEFFFTPGPDIDRGYFNLEMNYSNTMLLHFQKTSYEEVVHLPVEELNTIQTAHSLPRIVEPEIEQPVTWTVEYRLPLAILDRYCQADRPSPGTVWQAHFYKCSDRMSHPQWLSWSPIHVQPPDFHRPVDFGILEFK